LALSSQPNISTSPNLRRRVLLVGLLLFVSMFMPYVIPNNSKRDVR